MTDRQTEELTDYQELVNNNGRQTEELTDYKELVL